MFHHRGQRDGKGLSNLAYREPVLACQAIEDRTPGRVGESAEGAIELRFSIVNHVVKYFHRGPGLSREARGHHAHLNAISRQVL